MLSYLNTHDSKTVNNKLVVIPPIILDKINPARQLYCSIILIITSNAQYAMAEFLRPNLSTIGPRNGEDNAPAINPVAYKLATL